MLMLSAPAKRKLQRKRQRELGFTLIELMVVIAIIGFMAGAVVLSIPDPRGSLIGEVERFAAKAQAVRDEAVMTARATQIETSKEGYQFAQRKDGEWAEFQVKPLIKAGWQDGTSANAAVVAFDPLGLPDQPDAIIFTRDGTKVTLFISADGAFRIG